MKWTIFGFDKNNSPVLVLSSKGPVTELIPSL